ncbi:MAG: mannosyltransferase family protein [Patescibacteria group bacterium]|nr:mannosyltransferase family protein [Patescibacteria group bacterium]
MELLSRIWGRLKGNPAALYSLILVSVWRSLLEIFNQVQAIYGVHTSQYSSQLFHLTRWAHWDSGWYLDIVTSGYRHIHIASGQENFAFFPMFPTSVKYIGALTHINFIVVGLLLNFLLTIVAAYFLYKIAEIIAVRQGNLSAQSIHRVAILSVVGLLLFPASYFMEAFYAESFLLAGTLGAIYYSLSNKLWQAALFIAIATATKSLGLVALLTAGVIVLEQAMKGWPGYVSLLKKWLILSTGLSGLLSYALYLWIKFGDPLLFYKIQASWGRSNEGFFVTNILDRYYAHILQPSYFTNTFNYTLNLFIMAIPILILAEVFYIALRYKTYWPAVLGVFALAIPLSTGIMESLNRYIILTIPLFSFLITDTIDRKKMRWVLLTSLIASALLMTYFLNGYLDGVYFAG